MLEDIKPSIDLPFDEAIQELTGFEVMAISKHYNAEFEKLGAIKTLMGVVWAFECRTHKTEWVDIQNRSIRELHGFFAAPDNKDPESTQNLESTISDTNHGG